MAPQRMISFFFQPFESGLIQVLKLDQPLKESNQAPAPDWRWGLYHPDGHIEYRTRPGDHLPQKECIAQIKLRFPTFTSFFNWCMEQPGILEEDGSYNGNLNLSTLTSAEGLKLPKEVKGSLNLASLKNASGLNLPVKVGNLNLYSLTDAKELILPGEIKGYLYLNSLTSAAGLKFPKKVEGYLYLGSLTNTKGLELPEQIGRLTLSRKARYKLMCHETPRTLVPWKVKALDDPNLMTQMKSAHDQGKGFSLLEKEFNIPSRHGMNARDLILRWANLPRVG